MCKLSFPLLCAILLLGMCVGAYARGGTYHHADPVFVNHADPVFMKSNETTKKPIKATVHDHRHKSHKR
jgi:hypothetical protein